MSKRMLWLVLLGTGSLVLGWWLSFTASFLYAVVPHGGAW